MTGRADSEQLYVRLRQHYTGEGLYQIPRRKELLQILEIRYTPEEAELAFMIPVFGRGRVSLAQLAERTGKQESEIRPMVESLLKKGLLFAERGRGGDEVFCLWDLFYSAGTPLFGDGFDNDERRRITDLRESLWEAGYSYTWSSSRYPTQRVFPHEGGIAPDEEVAPWERASYFVEKAEAICVVACGCRASVNRCHRPLNNCVHFDREAEYWVKYRGGRYISKDECLQIMRDGAKAGLVITGPNDQEMPRVFCNCCPDCCVLLRPYIENHNPHAFAKSNFMPFFDSEKCRPCNICPRACPVGAIARHLSHDDAEPNDRMLVVEERCIGCGVCTAVCPRQAISLKRVRDLVPEPGRRQAFARTMAEQAW